MERPIQSPLELSAVETSPWEILRELAQAVVDLLEELQAPLLAVGVDGEIVLAEAWVSRRTLMAHSRFPGMPHMSPEEIFEELLGRLESHHPNAQLVELFAQWPNPAGVQRKLVARVIQTPTRDARLN